MNCKVLYPCGLVIVNDSDFGEILEKASNNLKRDDLKFFMKQYQEMQMEKFPFLCQTKQASSEIMDIINIINYAMVNFDNPQILCKGTFSICKPKLTEYTGCPQKRYR